MLTIDNAREWYQQNEPVHGFDHILRVYANARQIAAAEGADFTILHAAVLLHDVDSSQLSVDGARRKNHQHSSAAFARQVLTAEGWDEERIDQVLHCIRSHRFRDEEEQPQSLEAKVLFDADKLDAIGAIGVARAIAYAVQAGAPIYSPPSGHFLHSGQLATNEQHSAYHEFLFKLRHLHTRFYTPSGKKLAKKRHRLMEDFFQHLAHEMALTTF